MIESKRFRVLKLKANLIHCTCKSDSLQREMARGGCKSALCSIGEPLSPTVSRHRHRHVVVVASSWVYIIVLSERGGLSLETIWVRFDLLLRSQCPSYPILRDGLHRWSSRRGGDVVKSSKSAMILVKVGMTEEEMVEEDGVLRKPSSSQVPGFRSSLLFSIKGCLTSTQQDTRQGT
ncbi:unnamed protein product [Lactuca saligna]|uniref:Uncharacterized protein n=1 Tax=Lactuca saligna TaxID=75948 RepID=A0AA35UV49_LACSI|nr:unnamed protein product [Lactuca saligna]